MNLNLLKTKLFKKKLPVLAFQIINQEQIIVISHKHLLKVLFFLKNHIFYQYSLLSCISGVDFLGKKYRFCVVYDLLSLVFNERLRIKVFVKEFIALESISQIFINSNWWEREVWDLYGIYFNNHPDLRRILTDYGFEGFPMRKDFPLMGYTEVRYDLLSKQIVIEPVELTQEFRLFQFELPWYK